VWEADTGKQVREPLEAPAGVVCVAFDSTAGMLVSGGFFDNDITIWDLPKEGKATVRRRLQGHTDVVDSTSLSPDERYIASGSRDKSVRVWEAATGELVTTLEGHEDEVRSVVWSGDGQWLASGSFDKTVRLWRVDAKVRQMCIPCACI
jgi:WD40 repeat protein